MNPFLRAIVLSLLLSVPLLSFSQVDTATTAPQSQPYSKPAKPKSDILNRIYVGGYLGLSFGSVTYISVSPLIGYRWTKNLTAGVGFTYQYYQDNYYNYSSNTYGGLVFVRYNVYKGLFLETDIEANNLEAYTYDPTNALGYTLARKWIPSWLVGGGYSGGGSRGGFYISVLYDVLQDPNSPYYGIPVIRAGVGFGI